MLFTVSKIKSILKAKLLGEKTNSFNSIIIDSRTSGFAAQSLFVAIKGDRHNGHIYIKELYSQGCRCFLVSEEHSYYTDLQNSTFLLVNNTLTAVQQLAAYKRSLFDIPVVGITGSNGKTIVKEWLWQLLSPDYNVCKNPKSYNSQIGVPLSVWQLSEKDNFAVFEAGISLTGEMEKLEKIIQPTFGIITNIGSAHDENFESRKHKTAEKLKLFRNCKTIFYSKDYKEIAEVLPKCIGKKVSKISWSYKTKADLQIVSSREKNGSTTLKAKYNRKEIVLVVPFTDKASLENCIHCWLFLLHLNYSNEAIQKRISDLSPLGMRLEMKQGVNNCTLINDAYSNDIHSLSIALDFLKQQKQHENKVVILSDILQSGKDTAKLYAEVNLLLENKNVKEFVGIGKDISSQKNSFTVKNSFYETTEDLLEAIHEGKTTFRDSVVLIKGARSFGFERIQKLLQEKSHDTVLEINLNNLVHNLNYYRAKLRDGTGIMPMVKAFSYGSGSFEIANALQHNRVNYFAVAYADEGVELRKNGIATPIMVMNPELQSIDQLIQYNLEPEVFSFGILDQLAASVSAQGKNDVFSIHIKLDTGMHRLGFDEKDIPELIKKLKLYPFLKVKSIFSHLVASDDPSFDDFTHGQIKTFSSLSEHIITSLGYPVLRHICNSGAISRFPEAHFDMVRLGIGLYGVGASPDEQKNLLNVSSLKTTISQIKNLKEGDTVGYNRRGKITKSTTIATIPIGYADGLNRKLGNGAGHLYVNGKPASIVGNVCMDMCMIDVTDLNAKEGDEVIVFDSFETLKNLADTLGTIIYEILTSVSARVKRVYLQE
ncbi:MAG: bifunctional UDP-N-acetylmuramoyl-tripeptide:D-alanyl-D-alanine ligase/alanine racemase [Bacteroidia bacterium]